MSIVAPSTGSFSAYDQRVIDDGAAPYWSLSEASGSVAIDSVGFDDGIVGAGVTRGAPGSIIGDARNCVDVQRNGQRTRDITDTRSTDPNVFTVSAWIRTTTTSGGKIIGFGNTNTGNSGSYDRHVYMDNSGRIWFGVYPGSVQTLNSTTSYNDGQWHQVVASLGADGMRLSIDGRPIASRTDVTCGSGLPRLLASRWRQSRRVGRNHPTSNYFAGDIDNVAFFPTVLGRTDIRDQYLASGRTARRRRLRSTPTAPACTTTIPTCTGVSATPPATQRSQSTGSYGDPGTVSAGVTFGASRRRARRDTRRHSTAPSSTARSSRRASAVSNPTRVHRGSVVQDVHHHGRQDHRLRQYTATRCCQSNYDRHVYMQNDGKLVFGTYTGQLNTATSPLATTTANGTTSAATKVPTA